MKQTSTIRVGIIGGGLSALVAYTVLRFRGLRQHEIAVFSPHTSPEQSWQRQVRAINMQLLRSESIGHLYPTDSPGLATLEAINTWSLRPIIQSWFDRYHPTVDNFIQHVRSIARQAGFYYSLLPARVGHLDRLDGWFALYNAKQQFLAYAQHLILAVGHGPQRLPKSVAQFRRLHPRDSRVSLSYEPKTYAPSRTILVIGDGITAATEWANILEAGGVVAALSLNGFSFGQPLQVPRRYFSRRGLVPYRQQPTNQRLKELQAATRGTIPNQSRWKKLFRRAKEEGRLWLGKGIMTEIHNLTNHQLKCILQLANSRNAYTMIVDQVIASTGFSSPAHHHLLAHLIKRYNLKTLNNILEVDDNCCLETLSAPGSILAVIGPAAAWALPCADSLSGMKITAHRLANLTVGPESWSPRYLARQTARWVQLVTGRKLP